MGNSAGPLPPGVAGSGRGGADSSAAHRFETAKSGTAFRTIGEVSELLDTPTHVLRFWESRFPQVRPVKRAGGRRYYRPADVALLAGIRKLLHDDGLAIRGVQKMLRDQGVKAVADEAIEASAEAGASLAAGGAEAPAGPLAEAASDDSPDPATAMQETAQDPRSSAASAAPDAVPGEARPAAEDEAPLEQAPGEPAPQDAVPDSSASAGPAAVDDAPAAPTQAPAEAPGTPPDAAPDAPPRPRVLMRRRHEGDAPGLFSLMDAPEQPRPELSSAAPPAAEQDREPESAEDDPGRPLAALLRAASPALLAPHAKALAALHARLEAIKARRDCAGRGR